MRVVVGASSFADGSNQAMKLLLDRGIEVVKNPYGRRMNQDEIISLLQGADALLAGLEPLNEEVFQRAPQLKAIARIGIGMDNVDQEAAKAHGIKVSNTPEGPTQAVAEMTLTVLLSILHHVIPANEDVHHGIWKKRLGQSLSSIKVLIIGYGHIGQATAQILRSLGAEIMIYDKYNENASTCSLTEGIKSADVISLHASGADEIITQEMFSIMNDGVIILNSARGGLINEEALYQALKTQKISAFWGDALWQEPYDGMLKECENAILTPHLCTYTRTCRESMELQAVQNLIKDLGV